MKKFTFILSFLTSILVGNLALAQSCAINTVSVTNISCNDNGTVAPDDDRITFTLTVSGTTTSPSGYWIEVDGGTTLSVEQGSYTVPLAVMLGGGSAGSSNTYNITVRDKGDLTCTNTASVADPGSCSAGCSSTPVLIYASQTATLTAAPGLLNVQWYNSANTSLGSGTLIVSSSTPGMADGMESFYYTATDANMCPVLNCCPIIVQLQEFDLAIRKTINTTNTPGPYFPGDNVEFTIEVFNQGDVTATNIRVVDYIPSNMSFVSSPDFTPSGLNYAATIPTLAPSATPATLSITLKIDDDYMGQYQYNNAEITYADDDNNPGTTAPVDEDNPLSSVTGSSDDTSELATDNDIDDESPNAPGTADNPQDIDDYDVERVEVTQIFDLALEKTLDAGETPGPFYPGSLVTFTIEIFNQGTQDAYNIELVDYIPTGLALEDPDWSTPVGGKTTLINDIDFIGVGEQDSRNITFRVLNSFQGTSIINWAEITLADNDNNPNNGFPTDIDSTPDDTQFNGTGETDDLDDDGVINEDVKNGPAGSDEDDHDPAPITVVQEFDLALIKSYSSWTDTNMDGLISQGENVVFNITVYNQGTLDATNVDVTDYVPTDMTFTPGGVNAIWTGGIPTAPSTTIASIPKGGSATVSITLQVNAGFTGTSIINDAEITAATNALGQPDEDSTPNDNSGTPSETGTDNDIDDEAPGTPGTADNPDDNDDYDPAEIIVGQVFDLAIRKIATGGAGSYAAGDPVPFTVEVFNQGTVEATNVVVKDYIPTGMSFVSSTSIPAFSLVGAEYLATIPTLAPGASITLDITLTVQATYMGYTAINNAEIISAQNALGLIDQDSPLANIDGSSDDGDELDTDNDINDEAPGTPGTVDNPLDVDDYDPALINVTQVFDLALKKTLNSSNPNPIIPGGLVTFNIEIENQGTVDAYNIELVDYIPTDMELADATWTESPAGIAKRNSDIPFLAVGEFETVTITLRVKQSFQGTQIINWAEIWQADNDDIPGNGYPTDEDSTPDDTQFNGTGETNDLVDDDVTDEDGKNGGDEDDHDPAPITVVQEFDLALIKSYSSWTDTNMDGLISQGENVVFNITVYNQGTLDATNVDVTDYVPTDMTFTGGGVNAIWTGGIPTAPSTTIASIPKGGSATVSITLQVNAGFTGTTIINDAEITAATNALGQPDEDSTPGDNSATPSETGTDNDIDDEAPGTPGIADNPNDNDDYDPAEITVGQVFDLAIRKIATGGTGPYAAGDPVAFTVEVFNQGTVEATNVVVKDYIPTGMSFVSSPDFSLIGAEYLATIPTLAAGASVTLDITLTVQATYMGYTAINNAEIISAQNALGLIDQDSPLANIDGSSDDGDELDTDNDIDDEAPGTPGLVDNPLDVDDYDPALINVTQVFDLALKKTLNSSNPNPIIPGGLVTFNIEIENQGTVDAYNIELVDYIPTDMELADATWTESPAGIAKRNSDIPFLAVGEFETVTITLRVKQSFQGTQIINWAEIWQADNDDIPGNGYPTDEDSTPDDTNFNQSGETNDLADDDVTDEDGKNNGDEDDHDPAPITVVQEFDLALIKSYSSWTDTNMDGLISQGENVVFNITVYNQGTLDATNVDVTDYVPTDMTFTPGGVNAIWTGGIPTAPSTTIASIPKGGSATVSITLQVNAGFTGTTIINNAEITAATNALGQPDEDSTPNDNSGTPSETGTDNDIDDEAPGTPGIADNPNDNDDYDPAEITVGQVFDLAIRKIATGGTGPYAAGDPVAFTVEVFNQGTVAATNVVVKDYIPTGMSFVSSPDFSLIGAEYLATIPTLAPGASITLDITLTVQATYMGYTAINNAEIISAQNALGLIDQDSPLANIDGSSDDGDELDTDNDINDEAPGTPGLVDNPLDVDDYDPALINVTQVFDLALKKTLNSSNPNPIIPGGLVTFNIEIENQGTVDAYNIELVDYIPTDMELADATWTESPVGIAKRNSDIPFLAVGEFETVTITLRVKQSFQGTQLINWAEIWQADNDDIPGNGYPTDEDSTPDDTNFNQPGETNDLTDDDVTNQDGKNGGDEDDHDPAPITVVQEFDLALIKSYSSWTDTNMDGLISQGENVVFNITVYNQGTLDATNVDVTDYVPTDMTFTGGGVNAIWTGGIPTAPSTTIASIPKGGSATVSITLQVNAGFTGTSIINDAEITAATNALGQPDEDSTPNDNSATPSETGTDNDIDDEAPGTPGTADNPNDNDDYDPAEITVGQVFDLAIRKLINTGVTPGPYNPGDQVAFTVVVYNQGTLDATDIVVEDYIPTGMSFLSSPDFSLNGVQYLADVPVLAAGDDITLNITLSIDIDYMGDYAVNNAEIIGAENALGQADQDDPIDGMAGSKDDESELDTDNDIDDEAPGTPGTEDNPLDIDHYDPARVPIVQIFDLALIKQFNSANSTPIVPGTEVTFTLQVHNQGTVDAYNIELIDYIPVGLVLTDSDWTAISGNRATLNDDIDFIGVGEMVSRNITFTVSNDFQGTSIINYGEITSADNDDNPINGFPTDADSTPDMMNEEGDETGVDDKITDAQTNSPQDDDADEDDYDPAEITVVQEFDLALKKVIDTWTDTDNNDAIDPGENVTFDITVYNQGTLDATNIIVTDYVPTGMIFNQGDNATFSSSANGGTALEPHALIPFLAKGASITLSLTLNVDILYQGPRVVNNAEIIAGENALTLPDEDDPLNVIHGSQDDDTEEPTDNDVEDEYTGVPGDADNPDDVDDWDLAILPIGQRFDLALFKVYEGVYTDNNGDGVLSPGDNVTFRIHVINQGTKDAYRIQVTDYIPTGLQLIDPLWNNTPNVNLARLNTPIPFLAAFDETDVFIEFKIADFDRQTSIVNWAEISSADDDTNPLNPYPVDDDSFPDSIIDNDNYGGDNEVNNNNQDEDDHDPAEINPVIRFDLALAKKDQSDDPVSAWGEVRTFDIEVTNQGTVVATEFTVVDYVPCGMEFMTGPGVNGGWTYDQFTRKAEFIYDDSELDPNQTITLTIQLKMVYCADDVNLAWTNYAEISDYDDDYNDFNQELLDFDSDPDETNFDDPGGEPWGPSDDYIDGDGTGPVGSGPAAQDEDDHDPERVEVFDLALKKELMTINDPYRYGDLLRFKITVCNQGNIGAKNVVISDYLPDGFSFAIGNQTDTWVGPASAPTYTIPAIAVDDCEEVDIWLTIEQTNGGEKDWINYAEITAALNENDQDRTNWDVDSNPGSDGPDERAVEPNDPADDDLESRDKGGEEDDHDPAGIELFDLALRKVTQNQTGPYEYGDLVTFTFEIFNQGSIEASNIKVTDYIPCGFEYSADDNVGNLWNVDGLTGFASKTLVGNLAAGGNTTASIALRIKQCLDNDDDSFTNYAEITDYESEDPDYPDPEDVDSMTDEDPDNDTGGTPDDPTEDDNVDGDKYDGEDEDDHDPERIEVFDLALKKELLATTTPYRYGDPLTFKITVCNQGNVDARNIVVSDYLPAGFGFTFADNPLWSGTQANPTYSVPGTLLQDNCTDFNIVLTILQTNGGEKDWINYAEITNSTDLNNTPRVDADSNEGSDGPDERAVEPNDPADDDLTSTDKGGEEDDHDPAGIELFDLAQRKVALDHGPFDYGAVVEYTIEVFNQGSIEASGIVVTDYLPCGLKLATHAGNSIWSPVVGTDYVSTTLPGTLAPGANTSVKIYLEVQPCYTDVADAWTNYTEITDYESEDPDYPDPEDTDSMTDADPDNDMGGVPDSPDDDNVDGDKYDGEDEDDHDPERIEVFDLALRKSMVEPVTVAYGTPIVFDIWVFNQGNIIAENVIVTDTIPAGFFMTPGSSINTANGWSVSFPETSTTIPGQIAKGDSIKLQIELTLRMTSGGQDVYTNYAQITSAEDDMDRDMTNEDADSNPDSSNPEELDVEPDDPADDDIRSNDKGGEEDDHDPAGPDVFDLAITKKQQTALPSFSYGQYVMYDLQVYNQGNQDAYSIVLTDTIPCGLLFDSSRPANSIWNYNPTTREATTTIAGPLAAGSNQIVNIDLQVVECYEADINEAWTNYIEIKEADDNTNPNDPDPVDVDSTPDDDNTNDPGGTPNTDEDDHIFDDGMDTDGDGITDEDDQDPHKIQVFDLALRKIAPDRGPFAIGEDATFVITIFNQGNVPAANITVQDTLNAGYDFNAVDNTGLTGDYGSYSWATTGDPEIIQTVIPGPLMPNDSTKVVIKLEVATANFLAAWDNYAYIFEAQDTLGQMRSDDADSGSYGPIEDYDLDVKPGDEDDDEILEHGENPLYGPEDEDRSDPADVIVVGAIGDKVFKDLDGDGIQDINEPGVPNVKVTLWRCLGPDGSSSTTLDTMVNMMFTDDNGEYMFENILPGDYRLVFDISGLPDDNCDFTFQDQGNDDAKDSDVDRQGMTICTHIEGGERDSTWDAGLLVLASLGDRVWHDLDGDGIQDPGEPGIPNVTVKLFDDMDNLIGTIMTNGNGNYLFDKLYPGDYYVQFIDPDGFELTFPLQGGNTATDSDVTGSNGPGTTQIINLSPGENDLTIDAGYYMCVPIGELVWYDLDTDDYWDDNENGINGLRVNLWRKHAGEWIKYATEVTGHKPGTPSDDGYFKFCAPPGEYYLEFELPPYGLVPAVYGGNIGKFSAQSNRDSDVNDQYGPNTTPSIVVTSGDIRCDIGAGYYPMATVGDRVWRDDNADGIRQATEPMVPGVKVEAYNEFNEKVGEGTTDNAGIYEVDYLRKDSYFLKFFPPSGYGITGNDVGGNDALDSDVDHSNGSNTTPFLLMAPGVHFPNVDAGLVFGVLPIELVSFTGQYRSDYVNLQWTTNNEINSDFFVVERRHESEVDFVAIGRVAAAGISQETLNYNMNDYDVERSGIYYYRLKPVDRDGSFTYSDVISIVISRNVQDGIGLYPNPAVGEVTVEISLASDKDVYISLHDVSGKVIREGIFNGLLQKGVHRQLVDVSKLAAGVYTIQMKLGQDIVNKKLIIMRN